LGIPETKKVSRKTLTEGIIRPRLNEMFTMIRMQLERENMLTRVPSGAVLTGGGAETVRILESAKRILSLPVRIGKPKGISGLVDDILNPAYAVPVGLILSGVRSEPNDQFKSISKKLRLPTKGLIGKLVDTVKDLLP
jgi:cell division protein FtsA